MSDPIPTRPGHDRSVVALLASVALASSAALALTTALGKLVFDLTGRELDLGLLGLAEFAPAALLVFVTGPVADRHDRRRVGAWAALGEAAAGGGLAWYAGSDPTSVVPIYGFVVCFGVARAFAAPAVRSLPADIVEHERVPWLMARYSGAWQLAIIAGPLLGGFLYAFDVQAAFVAVMVLLVLAAAALSLVRPTTAPTSRHPAEPDPALEGAVEPVEGHQALSARAASWHSAVEGLAFVRRQPVLLGAISLDLFAVLFGGAVALLPAIADERLGVGAVGLGGLRAAGGIGAAAMMTLLAVRPLARRVGRTLLVAVAVFGVGTMVLGVTRQYWVAFAAMAALSAADAISVFIRATLVPLITPPLMRGRVLAVENVFIGASNELGAFESGVTGQLLGAPGAIVLGGAATIAVAAGWWLRFPALRDVDDFPRRAEP